MSREPYKRAVVTGATSGIGAATVHALCAGGFDVLAVARRADRLQSLADSLGCQTLSADIRDTQRMRAEIAHFAPDVVVNNAGVGHGITGLAGLAPEHVAEAIEINVIAPIQITAAAIEGMKHRGHGHIVNIGSISGLHTLVSAVYGASKAALHQFSQNLRYELAGTGLRVTEICPGRVASEFYERAVGDASRLEMAKTSGITELQPEDIASAILFAVNAPAHVNIATIELLPTEQAVGGISVQPAPTISNKAQNDAPT